jgi:hypothetical protein
VLLDPTMLIRIGLKGKNAEHNPNVRARRRRKLFMHKLMKFDKHKDFISL